MKAVIMCGGMGSRMSPVTDVTPKPLLPVCGKPLLDILIDRLTDAGCSEVYLTLGYMADSIAAYVEQNEYPIPVRLCPEEIPLGTAGGVKNALKTVQEDFIVLSGDIIFDFDLKECMCRHCESGAAVTLVGYRLADPRDYGTVNTDENNRIVSFTEKPDWDEISSDIINTGIYCLRPDIPEKIPEGIFFDFAGDLFPQLLRENIPMQCVVPEGNWGDVGDLHAYLQVNRDAVDGRFGNIVPPESIITADRITAGGSVIHAPSVIAGHIEIGADSHIGPYAVIGEDCIIGNGVQLSGSVVCSQSKMENGSQCKDSYIGPATVLGCRSTVGEGCFLAGYNTVGNYAKLQPGTLAGAHCKFEDSSVSDGTCPAGKSPAPDIFADGMSGTVFASLSLQNILRFSSALASLAELQRIGVSTDGTVTASVYKNIIRSVLQASGKTVYDFGTVFRSQRFFLSEYCSLDFFIAASNIKDRIELKFSGKSGMPVDGILLRKIRNAYRYEGSAFVSPYECTESFDMNPITTVYKSFLTQTFAPSDKSFRVAIDCENRLLFETMMDVLVKRGYPCGYGGIIFMIDRNGEKFYAVEEERAFSYDRILTVCCRDAFENGENVTVSDEAPSILEKIAERYGKTVKRLPARNGQTSSEDVKIVGGNCWAWDAMFCIAKVIGIMQKEKKSLAELSDSLPVCCIKRAEVDISDRPGMLYGLLADGEKDAYEKQNGFYVLEDERGILRLRQSANGKKIKMIAEAVNMESAREITSDMIYKIQHRSIDK